jgi:hypothetical protein
MSVALTQTWYEPTAQQSGFAVSLAQSDFWAQT